MCLIQTDLLSKVKQTKIPFHTKKESYLSNDNIKSSDIKGKMEARIRKNQ